MERRILKDRLRDALDEAWTKVNAAFQDTTLEKPGFEKKIWLAAEAAEYSSLLFSMTYSLEDVDPPVDEKKNLDRVSLVKESVSLLRHVTNLRNKEPTDAYTSLRSAVHYLRRAYLGKPRKPRASK